MVGPPCPAKCGIKGQMASFELEAINTTPNQPFGVWRSWITYLGSCCSILELLPHIVLSDHLVISVGAL
jgi:hypothetical protein